VEASKVLPGSEEALKMFQETDELEQLAERELMNAADTIAQAAKTLLEAKQRQLAMRKNKDSPLPEEEITEAILDAARAITVATATLVQAATAAQKELVAKGQISSQQSVYRRDPAWAKGLISAAQSVAGTVKDLVGAANGAAQGKAEEEALIASAKGVAAATARLVFASRAKADPFSPTQKKLSAAAKSVAEATQQLVAAAKSTTEAVEEKDSAPDWEATTQTEKRKAEVEAQVKILKLQKELEKERVKLGEMRKNEYKDANPNAAKENIAASAPGQRRPTVGSGGAPLAKSPSGSGQPSQPAVKKSASATTAPTQFFPLEHLQQRPVPTGLDAAKLELYLSDEDFVKVFGMDKTKFAAMPGFKQSSEKQKKGLL
jgi:talin